MGIQCYHRINAEIAEEIERFAEGLPVFLCGLHILCAPSVRILDVFLPEWLP